MIIEKTILDYLISSDIIGSDVYLETPDPMPSEYVLIEKTGSSESDHLCGAVIALQSITDGSLYRAAEINEAVKKAMQHITDSTPITSSELNTDYNYTNTTTKQYRYQAVFNIHYIGE